MRGAGPVRRRAVYGFGARVRLSTAFALVPLRRSFDTGRAGRMANAPVLKTGVRKDLGVRIPRPPFPVHTAERRKYPFDFPRRSPRWTEIAASGIATAVLFLAALVSMTSLSDRARLRSELDESRTQTRVTFLPPPAPLPPAPRPREKPVQLRTAP